MKIYWTKREGDPQAPGLVANRKELVKRFNEIVGVPSPNDFMFQLAFIAGKVPYENAVSNIRIAADTVAMAPRARERSH